MYGSEYTGHVTTQAWQLPAELVQAVPQHYTLSHIYIKVADLTSEFFGVCDKLGIFKIDHLFVAFFSLLLPSLQPK